MQMTRVLALFAAAVLVSSCIPNYQYRATGTVAFADGVSRGAVLYWHKDEGRLWYGARYEQADTELSMLVCEVPGKKFSLGTDGALELLGKAGDMRVAMLDPAGKVAPVTPEPVSDGARCGSITLDGTPTHTGMLREGTRPVIAILCENATRPDRYPVAGEYVFGPVSRQKSPKDQAAPSPCVR